MVSLPRVQDMGSQGNLATQTSLLLSRFLKPQGMCYGQTLQTGGGKNGPGGSLFPRNTVFSALSQSRPNTYNALGIHSKNLVQSNEGCGFLFDCLIKHVAWLT